MRLFLLFYVFGFGQAFADVSFYRAEVPVADQSVSARRLAARQGLEQVMVRMSGSEAVLNNNIVRMRLNTAPELIEQFQYRANEDLEQRQSGLDQVLTVKFSESAVKRILREANAPFWPVNRPSILVWLVEDHPETGRHFLGPQSESPFIEMLLDSALRRGLNLIFPLIDLEDNRAIQVDQVWQMNRVVVEAASQRYAPGAVLMGRVTASSRGDLFAFWMFQHRDETFDFDLRETSLEALAEASLLPVATSLAKRYAVLPGDNSNAISFDLLGIDNFAGYRRSLRYLESVALVESLVVEQISDDRLSLLIQSESGVQKLVDSLALDGVLVPFVPLEQGEIRVSSSFLSRTTAQLGSREKPLLYVLSE